MRPLIQVVVSELEGVQLVALNLFNERGQRADQVVCPIKDELTLIDVILDTMKTHRLRTVDVETDVEELVKVFIQTPGVNVTLVPSADLAALYQVLTPANHLFPVIQELYLSQEPEEEPQEEAGPSLWSRFLSFIRNIFKRKDDMNC